MCAEDAAKKTELTPSWFITGRQTPWKLGCNVIETRAWEEVLLNLESMAAVDPWPAVGAPPSYDGVTNKRPADSWCFGGVI